MEALVLAAVGILAFLLAGVWDLGRRWLQLSEKRPDPAAVETFEIQQLAQAQARIAVLEQTQSAALEQMKNELADAKAERRSAAAKVAATARWEKEHTKEDPEDPAEASNVIQFDALDPDRQAELLEAHVGGE